ncbi:uncharacterized [Tachysurus ichikawai]
MRASLLRPGQPCQPSFSRLFDHVPSPRLAVPSSLSLDEARQRLDDSHASRSFKSTAPEHSQDKRLGIPEPSATMTLLKEHNGETMILGARV